MGDVMTLDELKALAREYLEAEREYRSAPCLHRYRGIVRTREIARRRKRWYAAHDALTNATKETP